jgi:capsular polysaccharide biosynthesis protein
MDEALLKIRQACELLEQGRLDETLEALAAVSDPGEKVITQSIALTARGLMHEQAGETEEADNCFARVFKRGVPLPVLLRESGRYFKRTGQYRRAYQCFALLRNFEDPTRVTGGRFGAALNPRVPPAADRAIRDAVTEFVDGLPPAELARYAPWVVRELTNTGGLNPWYLPALKQALEGELGPRGAALAFATMAGKSPASEVGSFRLTSLRDFARSDARVYEELFASRTVEMPPARVFGADRKPSAEAETRTMFFAVLEDAVVSSMSNLLVKGDSALLDYQDDELERFPVDLSPDPLVFGEAEDSVTLLIDETAASAPPLEQAFPLVGPNSSAFGHLLLEFLPKVLACRDRPGFDSVPLLIDEDMPPQHREAFELFLGPEHPIEELKRGEAVRVKRLWTCSMPHYLPLGHDSSAPVDGDAFAELIERARSGAVGRPTRQGPRRLYLTRRRSLPRKLVNRDEVEAWFSARGFEILDFEELSFADQIELARGAELMVGPEGSSLLMSLFAGPGTRIGWLSTPYVDTWGAYQLISRSLGQHLLALTGEPVNESPDPGKSDYRIEVESLPDFLRELESMVNE